MSTKVINTFRDIPQIEKILSDKRLGEHIQNYSKPLVTRIVRKHVNRLRKNIKAKKTINETDFYSELLLDLKSLRLLMTNRVINATGILVHTNLGRIPLGGEIFARLREIISGYSSLEFDLKTGTRGSRGSFLFELLSAMTGAEAGIAVNNNASAVMLILNTFGLGKKCIVSRGEQVQIGGGFRMNEVATRSGVILTEVGATNRTVLEDYRDAIDDQTAILFKVHLSNFKQIGFTEETSIKELVELGKKKKITVVYDLGSGAFINTSDYGLTYEPNIYESLSTGVDLVCFSGDKLFGGPQAGIILGKKSKVAAVKKNPLYRTVRLDKIILTILEELVINYMKNDYDKIPLIKMLSYSLDDLKKRARKIKNKLKDIDCEVEIIETEAFCGGGSLPEESFPSIGLKIKSAVKPRILAKSLRYHNPPVVGRIKDDNLILDMRTIFASEEKLLVEALRNSISE